MSCSNGIRLAGLLLASCILPRGVRAEQDAARCNLLRFDSSSHVELATTVGLLKQEATFTVELWTRAKIGKGGPFALLGDFVLGRHPAVPHPNRAGWFVGVGQTSDGTLALQCAFGPLEVGGPLNVGEGEWFHMAVVNTSNGVDMFVNGVRWFEGIAADKIKGRPSPINLHVGKTQYDGWKISDHEVDIRAVRISAVCLYTEEFEPPEDFDLRPDTLVLLDFENVNGGTIPDLSGHQHRGTLRGPKWLPADRSD